MVKNAEKTHCPHGHPYVEGNIVWGRVLASGKRARVCAECKRQLQRRNQARYRASKKADPEWRALQSRRAKEYAAARPKRERAQWQVEWEIRKGTLVRPATCEHCGKQPMPPDRIEASHNSYDRPLEVEWLCRLCHAAKDRKLKLPNDRSPTGSRGDADD